VNQELVHQMNEKLQPYLDRENLGTKLKLDMAELSQSGESLMAGNTYRIWGLLGKMPQEICAVMQNPIWSGVMEHFLTEESADFFGTELVKLESSYTLNIANSFTVHPGAERQALHRDHRK
jgi:hypothetical protein